MLEHYYYLFSTLLFAFLLIGLAVKDVGNVAKKIKLTLPGMLFTIVILAMIEARFFKNGIINFNEAYTLSVIFFNLPVEKWIFYGLLSMNSVFAFEAVNRETSNNSPNIYLSFSLILLLVVAVMTFIFRSHVYTFFVFFLLSIYWAYTIFRNKFKQSLKAFLIGFLILLMPFLIFQAIIVALPIETYHKAHIIGLKIFSIPIESIFVLFLVMLINVTFYLYLKALK